MAVKFDTSRLTANLEEIRERVATTGRRKAVRAGARVIAAAMAERAPVQVDRSEGSNSLPPGELKRHIKARSSTNAAGEPVGLAGPDGEVAYVAHLVEYGHRMVSGGKSEVLPHGRVRGPGKVSETDVPAYPFLRPAYEGSADAALEAVTVELRNQFEGK